MTSPTSAGESEDEAPASVPPRADYRSRLPARIEGLAETARGVARASLRLSSLDSVNSALI